MNFGFQALFHVLDMMFLIGVAGCVITIPLVAYKMFSVLFERDQPQDE